FRGAGGPGDRGGRMASELISVILPVHNQAEHLRVMVEGHMDALNRLRTAHEIILIENGSIDESANVAAELARSQPTVRFAQSPRGWGRAIKVGLQVANGDLLCYTNSARTTPQELGLLLLYALTNPGVVVKANRKIR